MANTHLDPSREYYRDHPNEGLSLGEQVTCECECAHHFEEGSHHRYNQEFPIDMTTKVKTIYGVFRVCKGCAVDLKPYIVHNFRSVDGDDFCPRCGLPLSQCFCKSRREG